MEQQAEERKFMLEAEQEATQNALDRETNIKIAEKYVQQDMGLWLI